LRDRPSILFAIADDASHMSAYGHQFLRTPNFDRVARAGVRFTAAFTTNPK
jgi:arylsulfatase A-like enzyme